MMAMNNWNDRLLPVICLTVIILSLGVVSRSQVHPAGFLLDLDSTAAAAESPVVCHGDSLVNNFHRNQHPVKVITEDADLFIGALLNVHDSSPGGGFFSCGNITPSGLIAFEALNWISSTINQEHGLINGKPVVESFIPGVRIGESETRDLSLHSGSRFVTRLSLSFHSPRVPHASPSSHSAGQAVCCCRHAGRESEWMSA